MAEDREQLNDRYLEAQLREELGIDPDLSESVLREVYARQPRRVIPGPRRPAAWRPLAAAAAVLIAAGVATYALVKILPDQLEPRAQQAETRNPRPQPQKIPDPRLPTPPDTSDLLPDKPEPQPEPQPETKPDRVAEEAKPGSEPQPSKGGTIDTGTPPGGWPPDVTDPPDSWPDPKNPIKPPEDTAPAPRAVLVGNWKGDSLRVTREGREEKWKAGEARELLEGDRVQTRGACEFVLTDGGLLRLDGELTFAGEARALKLTLHDGVLYADTAGDLWVETDEVGATVAGVAVLEERLHGMDVFCVSGQVTGGIGQLHGGFRARLEKDGFGREKAITWGDVQREFRFLKEAPMRVMLAEELAEAPGELFGGSLKEGVLTGDVDSDVGIGFYLRQPYEFRHGDVVRFRFRAAKACEMILQFGTVGDDNWRHKMGGVKAGEWIDYELPLAELYKTTDVARRAEPGLTLKFFQLHPEEAKAVIEIDRVEIVHRP